MAYGPELLGGLMAIVKDQNNPLPQYANIIIVAVLSGLGSSYWTTHNLAIQLDERQKAQEKFNSQIVQELKDYIQKSETEGKEMKAEIASSKLEIAKQQIIIQQFLRAR